MSTEVNLMMKCDMCYDRTSIGLKPMCASVCPSQALHYTTRAEMARLRPNARPVNSFRFGDQTIVTKVSMMIPSSAPNEVVDVTAAMHEPTIGHERAGRPFHRQPPRGQRMSHRDDEAATPDGRPFFDQPKWRRDFPVDWDRDEYVTRRELVKFIVLTSAAFAFGQCCDGGQELAPPARGSHARAAHRRR